MVLGESEEPSMTDVMDKLGEKALAEGVPQTPEEDEDDVPMLRERTKNAPAKTKKVYKLMRLGEDGKLYPLYIDRNAMPIELGKWYDANSPEAKDLEGLDAGYAYLIDSEGNVIDRKPIKRSRKGVISGLPNVDAVNEAAANGQRWMTVTTDAKGNRAYANVGINGSESTSTFALRPGWHAGSLPSMRQIGKGKDRNIRDNSFVWVEGEISADVDYQPEADANTSTKDIPTHVPTDGYYMKATNANKKASQADRIGWYIAGAFKPTRIISDSEARAVIDDWNAEHPGQKVEYDFDRENGMDFNAETMGFEERVPMARQTTTASALGDKIVRIVKAVKEHGFSSFVQAKRWAKENIVGEVNNNEVGPINISSNAIDKYLSEKAVDKSDNKDVHLSTLRVLPEVITESIIGEIHEDRERDVNVKDIVRLFGCISIDGKLYRVKTTVKRYNNKNEKTKAYSYEVTEIELLEGFSGTPHTQGADSVPTSNNSITAANLLKGVKNNKL